MTVCSDFISEDDFFELWGAQVSPTGDLFDYQAVVDKPLCCVWTVIESGDDLDEKWYASPGFHFVNKLGYVMTSRPWDEGTPDAIYFSNDPEGLDRP